MDPQQTPPTTRPGRRQGSGLAKAASSGVEQAAPETEVRDEDGEADDADTSTSSPKGRVPFGADDIERLTGALWRVLRSLVALALWLRL